jgi:3-hydroxyisobutyrate dehydrogenase-like beta-hydroxyacid dehydrogenase
MPALAFIGLGTMGFPMAGHLQQKNANVTVFNRTTSKAETWAEKYSGKFSATIADVVKNADIIFSCVGNDDDLRSVLLGENGALPTLKKGAIWVDHSTVSADVSRELAAVLEMHGSEFIDAPVSGGEVGAIKGQLTIMCGARPEVFAQAEPYIQAYAKAVTLMGPVGAGQLTKMVNQICIGGLIQALAEGINFGEKAGLDVHKVIEVISQGAASSWQMVNRHQSMIAGHYQHGFAVDWVRKDFSICLNEARRLGVQLPVTALVDQFYAEVQGMGGGRWDTSSLLARLKR